MSTVAIPEKLELAKTLSVSTLLPKQYQQQPGNILYAIEYAESLGVPTLTAVTGIHVIDGKPSASAQLIAGLVRRAGHKLRVSFDRGTMTARSVIVRADDPTFEYVSEWSMERAKAANLTGKGVWKSYPDAMLKARSITEVARDAASEVLFGLIYTAEELGATDVDQDGAFTGDVQVTRADAPAPVVADPFAATPAPSRDWVAEADALDDVDALRNLWQAANTAGADADVLAHIVGRAKAAAPAPDAPVDAVVVEPITAGQVKAIQTVAGKLFPDRDARLVAVSEVVGRIVGSVKDLDTEEAEKVLGVFKQRATDAAHDDPFGAPDTDPVSAYADATDDNSVWEV